VNRSNATRPATIATAQQQLALLIPTM